MSKFIVASRQATQLDKVGILLETRIQEVKDDWKGWAEMVAKAMDEAKEMQNLVEELTANIVEKDSCLDHLQKKNDELSTLIKKAKRMLLWSSKLPNSILIFRHKLCCWLQKFSYRGAEERIPEVDFNSIKLNIGATSSLLQTSSDDVNIEDDAITLPTQDDPTSGDNPQ